MTERSDSLYVCILPVSIGFFALCCDGSVTSTNDFVFEHWWLRCCSLELMWSNIFRHECMSTHTHFSILFLVIWVSLHCQAADALSSTAPGDTSAQTQNFHAAWLLLYSCCHWLPTFYRHNQIHLSFISGSLIWARQTHTHRKIEKKPNSPERKWKTCPSVAVSRVWFFIINSAV